MRRVATAVVIVAIAASLRAENLPALSRSPDLYVTSFFNSSVFRYFGPRNVRRGANPAPSKSDAMYAAGIARRPWAIAFGPDGNAYVGNISGGAPGIVRVDGPFSATPGAAHDIVDSGVFYDIAFGPDGNLYAAGRGNVRRYDLVTGEFMGDFTSGHTLAETRGIAFGADGLLYVSNYDNCPTTPAGCGMATGEIVRFDAYTGAFVDVWMRGGENGLLWPWKIAFSPTGDLLIVNWTTTEKNILLAHTGSRATHRIPRRVSATAEVFITHGDWTPLFVAIGPDANIYVSDSSAIGSILRFDGRTGAFLDTFIADVEGSPRGIAFAPGAR